MHILLFSLVPRFRNYSFHSRLLTSELHPCARSVLTCLRLSSINTHVNITEYKFAVSPSSLDHKSSVNDQESRVQDKLYILVFGFIFPFHRVRIRADFIRESASLFSFALTFGGLSPCSQTFPSTSIVIVRD